MKNISRLRSSTLAGLVMALAGNPAQSEPQEWRYEVTPYLWAARMNGDLKIGPLPQAQVHMGFSDILSQLDFGLMGSLEARRERWGVLVDGMYMKTSAGGDAQTLSAHLEMRQTLLSTALAYRIGDPQLPVDIVGGLRYNRISADVRLAGEPTGMPVSLHQEGHKAWIDPYLGLRLTAPLAGNWTAVAYGDVGGFHLGSDLTWQASLGLKYALSPTRTLDFGYRILSTDYDKDGFRYDMRNDGLYAGISFSF